MQECAHCAEVILKNINTSCKTMSTAPIFTSPETVNQIVQDAETITDTPVTSDLVNGGESISEDATIKRDGEVVDSALSGGDSKVKKSSKKYYNVVAVIGGEKPSDHARFSGSSPGVAASKAGRRIFKKSGNTSFDVILRRVAPVVAKREMFKYHVDVSKSANPTSFFTASTRGFTNTSGVNVDGPKRIRIVRDSTHPVHGDMDTDGVITTGGSGHVHRAPGTNTLTYSVAGGDAIPTTVQGVSVITSEHDVRVKKVTPSSDEVDTYDVAFASKQAAKAAEAKIKARQKDQAAKAKAKASSKGSRVGAREKTKSVPTPKVVAEVDEGPVM